VKSAQNLGFSLDEIIDLLRLEDGAYCQEASVLAEHKLESVRGKIKKLERIEGVLSDMVTRCHIQKGDVQCPLIASLHTGISEAPEV